MVLWETFYPLVMPWAPGAAEINVDSALRQAAIDFCQRTLAWQVKLDRVFTAANEEEVECDLTTDQAIAKLLTVKLNGKPLGLTRPADFDHDVDNPAGLPRYALTKGPRSIVLVPAPAVAGTAVDVRAALMPSQASTGVPDDVFELYAKFFANGALKELCSQPGQSFTNSGISSERGVAFEGAIAATKVRVYMGYARTNARVVPSYF